MTTNGNMTLSQRCAAMGLNGGYEINNDRRRTIITAMSPLACPLCQREGSANATHLGEEGLRGWYLLTPLGLLVAVIVLIASLATHWAQTIPNLQFVTKMKIFGSLLIDLTALVICIIAIHVLSSSMQDDGVSTLKICTPSSDKENADQLISPQVADACALSRNSFKYGWSITGMLGAFLLLVPMMQTRFELTKFAARSFLSRPGFTAKMTDLIFSFYPAAVIMTFENYRIINVDDSCFWFVSQAQANDLHMATVWQIFIGFSGCWLGLKTIYDLMCRTKQADDDAAAHKKRYFSLSGDSPLSSFNKNQENEEATKKSTSCVDWICKILKVWFYFFPVLLCAIWMIWTTIVSFDRTAKELKGKYYSHFGSKDSSAVQQHHENSAGAHTFFAIFSRYASSMLTVLNLLLLVRYWPVEEDEEGKDVTEKKEDDGNIKTEANDDEKALCPEGVSSSDGNSRELQQQN